MKCKYCYGKCMDDFGKPFLFDFDSSLPCNITYDVGDLAKFLNKDVEPVIIFYGGEPTIALDKMKEIMDNISVKEYIMQTNGLLLNRIESEYCKKFNTVLVSIDGDESLTDYYRGGGTYRRVIDNLKSFRDNGFKGELIARMTVGPETNIQQAVKSLIFNKEFPFKSVHWQLDALFWQNDYKREYIEKWFDNYNKCIQDLVVDWFLYMKTTGIVLRIYPFVGIMESLLLGTTSNLRCGAGWTVFNVQTNGIISPCPVMAGMKEFYLGDIKETDPKTLINAILVKEPCLKCSSYNLCGGRCLYANVTNLWGNEGYNLVCGTVKNLINSLKSIQHLIHRLINNKQISLNDFKYPKYNSCEIIP